VEKKKKLTGQEKRILVKLTKNILRKELANLIYQNSKRILEG